MWSHINNNIGEQYVCISEDVKPNDAPNGAILIEMDTAIFYMFDKQNGVWHPITKTGGTK